MTDVISAYDFTSTIVPDVTPETESSVDNPCEVCGKDTGYSGRGRKPRFCVEHRKSGPKSDVPKNSNAKLAAQAADALVQVHSLLGTGAFMLGMLQTSTVMSERLEVYREQMYQALLTDPAKCRMILRAGTSSSTVAMLLTEVMYLVAVAPVAYMEFKAIRASKSEAE